MENPFVFDSVLSVEEWQKLPVEIGKTLLKFVNEKFEEFITSKALLETKTFSLGMYIKTLKCSYIMLHLLFLKNKAM